MERTLHSVRELPFGIKLRCRMLVAALVFVRVYSATAPLPEDFANDHHHEPTNNNDYSASPINFVCGLEHLLHESRDPAER